MSSVVDTSGIFNEIVTRMEDEATMDREAYYDLVEEVLEEKREAGVLTDDDDTEEMEQVLKTRWPDAQATLESGHDRDVIEEE